MSPLRIGVIAAIVVAGPPLWMATTSPKSVDRAVRYDSHVLPQGVRELVLDR